MNAPQPQQRWAFDAAVHALTAEPTSVNVVRYLVASRNLDNGGSGTRAPAVAKATSPSQR